MRWSALLSGAALLTGVDSVSLAAPEDAGTDPVVVSVGSSEVRASELRFRLGRLHEFERQAFGGSPSEVKRKFVELRLVPELLFAEEGRRRGALERAETAAKVQRALVQALREDLEREIDGKLTASELEAECRRAGGNSDGCKDLAGFRVVLRRQRAATEMDRLAREARERALERVDHALLDRIAIRGPDGSATPTSSHGQP